VVHARNATHRVDVRLVVEAEVRATVAVSDAKRDADRGGGVVPAIAIGAPPVVVGVLIAGPVPAIGRRDGVDGLRHGTVADEGPRALIAARAIPVAVVVHVPGVVVAIDVLIGALDVVHAGPARDRDDTWLVIEAQVGATVSVPDLKADGSTRLRGRVPSRNRGSEHDAAENPDWQSSHENKLLLLECFSLGACESLRPGAERLHRSCRRAA